MLHKAESAPTSDIEAPSAEGEHSAPSTRWHAKGIYRWHRGLPGYLLLKVCLLLGKAATPALQARESLPGRSHGSHCLNPVRSDTSATLQCTLEINEQPLQQAYSHCTKSSHVVDPAVFETFWYRRRVRVQHRTLLCRPRPPQDPVAC